VNLLRLQPKQFTVGTGAGVGVGFGSSDAGQFGLLFGEKETINMRNSLIGAARLGGVIFNFLPRRSRQAVAISISLALLHLLAPIGYANLEPRADTTTPQVLGTLQVDGNVRVNGNQGVTGQTLFSASRIISLADGESTLEFQNQARMKLGHDSSVTIESSKANLSAALGVGVIRALIPLSVQAVIRTPDSLIKTDSSQPASFSVLVEECSTTLAVQTGRVELRSGNNVRSLSAGKSFSTGAGPQLPGRTNSLSGRKKAGLLIGVVSGLALLLLVLWTEEHNNETPGGGCTFVPSGESRGRC
jgi:hypothetical protein